jgi:hypothetical protein
LPYLGHTVAFNRNPIRFLQAGRARFGDIFSFRFAGSLVTMFSGPQASEAFFRASDSQLSAREAYQFTAPVFGKGISYDTTSERMNEQLSFLFGPGREEDRQATYAPRGLWRCGAPLYREAFCLPADHDHLERPVAPVRFGASAGGLPAELFDLARRATAALPRSLPPQAFAG